MIAAGYMNIEDFAAQLSCDLAERVEILPIDDEGYRAEVPDATVKFHVRTGSGAQFFLIVSGPGNPQLMNRAVKNIEVARASVNQGTASHILQPFLESEVGGLTYAVWEAKKPFPLHGRARPFLARRRYAGPVLSWSVTLTSQTMKIADPAIAIEDLKVISEDGAFPQPMRLDALSAQRQIEDGSWRPQHCLQHGDFWAGNILLPTKPEEPRFYIIDWAGMQRDGYPFLDLARMLMSMRCNPHVCAHHIEKLRKRVACEHPRILSYTLSGLGQIGRNLEYFPPQNYRSMSVQVYNLMKSF